MTARGVRKATTCIIATLAAWSAAPVAAAVPANMQRLGQLRAVLDDPAVSSTLGMQPIDRIEFVPPDLVYRVTAGRCHVDVRIVYRPDTRGLWGPAFDV